MNNDKKKTEIPYEPNSGTLRERLAKVKTTRWVRFAIVAVIFLAWVAWLGSWWVLIFLPLLADIYLTQFIPYTWWKGCKNAAVRTVMSWVDAIVYALVLVYLVFAYIGQNYQIPSSSLEKTLLTGDFLWVNKMIYGPRVPMTPVHFPLTQNTFPIVECKSYLETPQWDYKRLKGFRDVERFDIVVFNFPAGDTIAFKVQNPDYYTLVSQYGREVIKNNKEAFGEVMYRPVDRRENYVKRCIGLPGERLKITDNTIFIDGKPLDEPKNVQYVYFVQTTGRSIAAETWEELGVAKDDINLIVQQDPNTLNYTVLPNDLNPTNVAGNTALFIALGLDANANGSVNPIYQVPLTNMAKETLLKNPNINKIVKVKSPEFVNVYPITTNYGWTHYDYANNLCNNGIWIPKKGATLLLDAYNLPIYIRCIKNYEGNDVEVKDGKIFINGKETNRYTFKMDYYWMMGDNRDMSSDSRYWGFVPEDHIVGSPMFVIVSFDKDKGWFDGKIRWNRVFIDANPDK